MPKIQVNLYAMLRKYTDGKPSVQLDIEPGGTVRQVLEELGVPEEHTRIIFVDNRPAGLDSELQGGEQLGIFSAIGGG